ncbi:MAG: cold shock domain-containing protein [Acidobacteriia bacterium]|nr:cold shock domain-containing protein [Terriglobia bacterium]
MLLPVQVTFRNMKDTAGLEELVQKEAATLERFYDRISSCRVMVERPQHAESSKLYHVRIDLGLPKGELVVKHTPTLHGALQDAKVEKSRREAESVLLHKSPERAIHEAFHEMRRRLQDYSRRQVGFVKNTQKMAQGTVKEIFPDKGYGFLETTDDRRIYFNQASVLDGHFDRLRAGTRVRFAEEMGEKGPQASTVKIIHPRKQAQTAATTVVLPRRLAAAKSKR